MSPIKMECNDCGTFGFLNADGKCVDGCGDTTRERYEALVLEKYSLHRDLERIEKAIKEFGNNGKKK